MAVQYQSNRHLESSFKHQDAGAFFAGFQEFLPQLVDQMASSSLKPDVKDPNISYEVIQVEDEAKVLKLLKETFFKDEPLNAFLQLGECSDLEDYCTKSIPDGCSFKAVNDEGEIVGVFLNGIIRKQCPTDTGDCSLASKTDHEKFKKIMSMMDLIDSKFSIFSLYPEIESFVDGKILSVDPKYRGHGIAGELTDRTIEFMKQNQIQIFHVLCTSHFSARVCEKSGFTEVFTLPFSDYRDDDGRQVLCPEKPHVAARIFTKKVYP